MVNATIGSTARKHVSTRVRLVTLGLLVACLGSPMILGAEANAADRPNILWLFAEDTSPWMGCYGDPINKARGNPDPGIHWKHLLLDSL